MYYYLFLSLFVNDFSGREARRPEASMQCLDGQKPAGFSLNLLEKGNQAQLYVSVIYHPTVLLRKKMSLITFPNKAIPKITATITPITIAR